MVHFNPAIDLNVDLTGKVIFVTGATTGIGFSIAQTLVDKGAMVYIGARSEERAKAAIKRIEEKTTAPSGGNISYWPIDLADPRGVKQSAEEFARTKQKLDVLINNAAPTLVPHNIDSNGVLDIMTVNYLSQVVLTEALLPLLKKTSEGPDADVRIINVGSDAYKKIPKDTCFKSKEDFAHDSGNGFTAPMDRYGRTKLALYLWTSELQRRFSADGSNIVVICANPGTVLTENFISLTKKNWRWPISLMIEMLFRLLLVSTIVGAGNPLVCAVGPQIRIGPDAERYKGSYTDPIGKIATPTAPPANSEELAKELWDTTHSLFTEWAL